MSQLACRGSEDAMTAEEEHLVRPHPSVQLPRLPDFDVRGIEQMAHRNFQQLRDFLLGRTPGVGRNGFMNEPDERGDQGLPVARRKIIDTPEHLYVPRIEADLFEAFT